MSISIICPLYNAEKYIEDLDKNIRMQKNVEIESIKYILTESYDNTEKILKNIKASYITIKKEQFSHSFTREKAAMESEGDVIVFITQDIIISDSLWLYNLTKDIFNEKCEASFSRQICENNSIEKYIREKNYPNISRIVDKSHIGKLGLITFFFSDASSAIRSDIFRNLNGYDGKDLVISEDMYIAYKIIMKGYKIKYCSDSVVIHSHDFSLKELYKRYFDTGKFFAENSYLNNYKVNQSGINLSKYVFRRALQEKNLKAIAKMPVNFATRFVGMKMGKINIFRNK